MVRFDVFSHIRGTVVQYNSRPIDDDICTILYIYIYSGRAHRGPVELQADVGGVEYPVPAVLLLHTHTHTYTHTHTHIHTRTRTRKHTHALTSARTRTPPPISARL